MQPGHCDVTHHNNMLSLDEERMLSIQGNDARALHPSFVRNIDRHYFIPNTAQIIIICRDERQNFGFREMNTGLRC